MILCLFAPTLHSLGAQHLLDGFLNTILAAVFFLWHSSLELCAYRCPSALANRLLGGRVSLLPCCYSSVLNGGGKLPYEVYRLPGMCQRKWVTSPLDPGFSQAYLSVCLTSNFSHQRWFFVRGERQELLLAYPPVALLLSKILLPPSVIKKRKILTEWE